MCNTSPLKMKGVTSPVLGIFADREAHPCRALTPFKVVRAFWVPLFLAVHDYYVWFDAAVGSKHNGAVTRSTWGLDSFGDIYRITTRPGDEPLLIFSSGDVLKVCGGIV